MRRLGIVSVGLALVVALAACTRTVEKVVVVTPSPAGTPTLTVEESAYVEAVATVQGEATAQAQVHARETVAAMPTRTPVPPPYKLALISADCHREYDSSFCEGFVQNISGSAMESIEAVAVFYDAAKTPISSASALIDYDPLLPGQQSHFSIYGRYNPAMTKWSIEFKEFSGGSILTRYDNQ